MKKSLLFYACLISFLSLWWSLAFLPKKSPSITYDPPAIVPIEHSMLSLLQKLSRKDIHQALLGDVEMMAKLFYSWKLEGDILASHNIPGATPFKQQDCERFHLLLQYYRQKINGFPVSSMVTDDRNQVHKPCSYEDTFLAQTFVSASFLLALISPTQIVAIPKGMRNQTHLYPIEITNKIHLNADRYASEKIFVEHPRIAFVASYSHSETIEMLGLQEVETFFLDAPERLENIPRSIKRIGDLLQRSIKAELLCLFMEAAYQAIDNQWAVYGVHADTIVVLNFFSHYAVLSDRNLTIQLLQRKGFPLLGVEQGNQWSKTISCEELVILNPSMIFVMHPSMKERLLEDPYFQDLPAVQNQRIHVLDDALHYSPNQLLVLGYLDYFEALR